MKLAVLICLMAATALAGPRYQRATKLDPRLAEPIRVAEQAWTAAEREPDPTKAALRWEQAAVAFGEIDAAPVDAKIKREAAYAAIVAWKNALEVDVRVEAPAAAAPDGAEPPRPLPAREVKLVTALDRYVAYVEPSDPEVPGVLLVKARTYARFGQLEAATPILRTIVDRHRTHEVAVYAASLLLDAYVRLRRYDRLLAFADDLAKDTRLMRANPELADVVRKIQRRGQRKRLEQLEDDAHGSRDLATYSALGTGYLELYNASPGANDGDELLYNAGVAFHQGAASGRAIQAFSLLQRRFPRSKLEARALRWLGNIYGDIAMYDRAAAKLEEYGRKYAGEKDALDAMSDAIYYRKALGDRDQAIKNVKYVIKTYGKRRPREAAEASWSLIDLDESDPAAALASLRAYLRGYGAKGGAARVVIAHAKIGELLWKQSCPHRTIGGLCVEEHPRAARTCGRGTARTLTPTPRQPTRKRDALAAFALAVKAFERQPIADDATARYYYAQSKLAIADGELEPYLAIAFPNGLTFAPASHQRADILMRFNEWIEHKRKTGARLTRAYEALLADQDAASSITAAARLGILAENVATALVTGELPSGVRAGPHAAATVKAYCDARRDVEAPLQQRAVEAFASCLAKSTELAWFGESSALCERALIRTQPDAFPAATELRARALFVAPVIASEPPPRSVPLPHPRSVP